jgi:hypothetical protein
MEIPKLKEHFILATSREAPLSPIIPVRKSSVLLGKCCK